MIQILPIYSLKEGRRQRRQPLNYERAAKSISIVDVGIDKYVRFMGQVRTSLETIWDTYIHNHTHTTTRTRTPARTHIQYTYTDIHIHVRTIRNRNSFARDENITKTIRIEYDSKSIATHSAIRMFISAH